MKIGKAIKSKSDKVTSVFPFVSDGLALHDIKFILDESGIGLPSYSWRQRSAGWDGAASSFLRWTSTTASRFWATSRPTRRSPGLEAAGYNIRHTFRDQPRGPRSLDPEASWSREQAQPAGNQGQQQQRAACKTQILKHPWIINGRRWIYHTIFIRLG